MAFAFENFALNDLVAKPEDAMRLASLAASTGQRIPAYGGEYYRYWMGDAQVVVRTWNNYETGEMELGGMDTHAASDAVWECEIADDLTPDYYDPLSRRLLVSGEKGGAAVVEVVNADVLPTFAVAVSPKNCSVDALEEKLRRRARPIIGRIAHEKYLLDVRTLSFEDFDAIAEAVKECAV